MRIPGGLVLLAAAMSGSGAQIRHIDLIHTSHTDVGFTDQPSLCREMQKRFLDVALDACLANQRFHWTAEAMLTVDDWWRAAPPERRRQLLQAVRSGRLEITALAFNNAPFLDAGQWDRVLAWAPEELRRELRPRAAMQNDVNGLPRAAAVRLAAGGVRYLMMGINSTLGGAPLPAPSAFWWELPGGRRLLVWNGEAYGAGFAYFHESQWRRGPVPRVAETAYRPPRPAEVFRTDESSLRQAQAVLLKRVKRLEAGGYPYSRLIVSQTNQWRMDNDPPYTGLGDFVAAWNRLGLQPGLRLTTPSAAMEALEAEEGARIPVRRGEWTDWWANGAASSPREVAASRQAKRLLRAARSPLWGGMEERAARTADELLRELCLFDEHTWGSEESVALPESFDTIGQFAEKSLLAWRPLAWGEWLLSNRARSRLAREPEGVYIANTAGEPMSGWVRFPADTLRGEFRSLEDASTGGLLPVEFEPGLQSWGRPKSPADVTAANLPAVFADNAPKQVARVWVEGLPGETIRRFRLSGRAAAAPASPEPRLELDALGWPVSATWPGMEKPLFAAGTGDFLSVEVRGFAPHWLLTDMAGARDAAKREEARRALEQVPGAGGKVSRADTAHTLVVKQTFRHPRLSWAVRTLELWRREPRARLTVRLHRAPADRPEAFYVNFTLPVEGRLPVLSNGGLEFEPFRDQLEGTCRDHFAVDGWAHYRSPAGHWLWITRDAPLVSIGGPQVWVRRKDPPADSHRLSAMVFNNFWFTNFVANSGGTMEFQFDLFWKPQLTGEQAARLAEAAMREPVVVMNPGLPEDPLYLRHLFRP